MEGLEKFKSEKFDLVLMDMEEAYNLILEAQERGDYKTVKLIGHSMKGAGRGYGIEGISDIGQSLIIAANSERDEDIKNKAAEFSKCLLQIEVV